MYFDSLPKELKIELTYCIYDDYNHDDFIRDELHKFDTFDTALIKIRYDQKLWKYRYENEISMRPPGIDTHSYFSAHKAEWKHGIKTSYKHAYNSIINSMTNIDPTRFYGRNNICCTDSDLDNIKLLIATSEGWEKMAENLISIGVSLDPHPGFYHLNAFAIAVVNGQCHMVKYLTSLPNIDFRCYYRDCMKWADELKYNDYKNVIEYLSNLI